MMPADNASLVHNIPEFSVAELSCAVQKTVEGAFSRLRVRGEISGCKRAPSGHLYLNLKDAGAVLAAVCWKHAAQRLTLRPEDGMEVVATGRLTTFAGQSRYQLIIDAMELAGPGALLALIEERKKKLAAEGLFALERKRQLPLLPAVIGIITSPSGAAIRDILHRLAERFPRPALIWPTLVQGDQAAAQIAAAIAGFNRLPIDGPVPRPDVLIVARGGGSIEDLMPFNEEIVVRAAAASAIALISAIGHETDSTLLDFVADRRAPTPSAAAEMAVPVRAELRQRIQQAAARLLRAAERRVEAHGLRLQAMTRGLVDPVAGLMQMSQRLDIAGERLHRALERFLLRKRSRIDRLSAHLPAPQIQIYLTTQRLNATANQMTAAYGRQLSSPHNHLARIAGRLRYQSLQRHHDNASARLAALGRLLKGYAHHRTLTRGFAVIRDAAGDLVLSAGQISPGDRLAVEFYDGQVMVTADAAKSKGPPKARHPAGGGQERLL